MTIKSNKLLNLIKHHWKKAAWGAVIFFITRFLIVASVGWWILSSVLGRRQEIKEDSEAFKSSFQEMSQSFEKGFNDTQASIKAKQSEFKESFAQASSQFDLDFEKARKEIRKGFESESKS